MKEIKLPDLPVRSTWYDGYHAKVAFSKITVESVNYKILKAINEHPSYTRDQINTEVDGLEAIDEEIAVLDGYLEFSWPEL